MRVVINEDTPAISASSTAPGLVYMQPGKGTAYIRIHDPESPEIWFASLKTGHLLLATPDSMWVQLIQVGDLEFDRR